MLYCKTTFSTCQFLNTNFEENERFFFELDIKNFNTLRYSVKVLQELTRRYEKPEAKNRWDSPLFEILIGKFVEDAGDPLSDNNDFETEIEFPKILNLSESFEAEEDFLPRNVQLPFDKLYQHLIEVLNFCIKIKKLSLSISG